MQSALQNVNEPLKYSNIVKKMVLFRLTQVPLELISINNESLK